MGIFDGAHPQFSIFLRILKLRENALPAGRTRDTVREHIERQDSYVSKCTPGLQENG